MNRIYQDIFKQVLEHALVWLTFHLSYFHPQPSLRTGKLDPPHKPFAELVFLCIEQIRLLNGCKKHDLGLRKHLNEVVAFISELIKTYDFPAIFWNDPEALPAFALLPKFASLVGLPTGRLVTELNSFVTEGYGLAMERLPFRYLDLRYTMDYSGITHNLPDIAQLYTYSIAARRPIIPYLHREDLYAITHTIFYVTDMGHQPIEETAAASDADHLRWLVQTLMGMMLWEDDLDLMGEFLMCARFLSCSWNYIIESSWKRIAKRQRESGVIPGPTFNEQDANDLDDKKLSEYEFVHSYHTTLVTILAALHWLREEAAMEKRGADDAAGWKGRKSCKG
jgi:hypothetical protein